MIIGPIERAFLDHFLDEPEEQLLQIKNHGRRILIVDGNGDGIVAIVPKSDVMKLRILEDFIYRVNRYIPEQPR